MCRRIPYLTAILLIFAFNSMAQRGKNHAIINDINSSSITKTPTDTLMPASFLTGTPVLYSYIDGGYCFGSSPLNDKSFAQKHIVPQSYLVHGIALWIPSKEIVGDADSLMVNFYRLEGPGSDTSGAVNNAPDSVFQSMKFSVADIDTTGLTFILFPDSFIAYIDYAVGIDISALADDTIGLVSTTDGDALQSQLSWVEWSDHTWHTVLEPMNWAMDVDFGIFIIADMSAANIEDNYFIEGIKLSQNQPNPASGYTFVQYELMCDAANVIFEIYDLCGKLVFHSDEGGRIAGQHTLNINIEQLNPGSYFYSLQSGDQRLTKKMMISHE